MKHIAFALVALLGCSRRDPTDPTTAAAAPAAPAAPAALVEASPAVTAPAASREVAAVEPSAEEEEEGAASGGINEEVTEVGEDDDAWLAEYPASPPDDAREIVKVSTAGGVHVSLWTYTMKGHRTPDEQVLVLDQRGKRKVLFVDDRHLSDRQRSFLVRTQTGVVFVSLQTLGTKTLELRQRFSWDAEGKTLVRDGERLEAVRTSGR